MYNDDQIAIQELKAAIDALRVLPPENPAAVSRIVAAARAQRGTNLIPNAGEGRRRHWWQGVGAMLAATLLFGVGFLVGGSNEPSQAEIAEPLVKPLSGDRVTQFAMNAGASTRELIPIPTVFQVAADDAQQVAVVGNFNAWDPAASPLTQSQDGVWQGTITLHPGRHTYAFMIDGKIVPDPKAVNMHDPDYDVIVSTLVVKETE